jgi:DNA invertase Pin-like site-specific DNA recombinase
MTMSEKISSAHLQRKAVLYVRQSSTYQVNHNLESQRLQYAMQERLKKLGWHEVEVLDEDLGRSAAVAMQRSGFQRLVAEVCMGKVGAVAAREVSRFARNSREWQHLVEVCRIVDTLLIDEETVYDARLSDDRLLLGLKGSLNEYELDLFRLRSQAARKQKAMRGELGMNMPVGYVNAGDGRVEKDPDQRVQQAIRMVFEKFLELGTARQVLMWFLDQGLPLPGWAWQDGHWQIVWRPPTYHVILRILQHPIYAGAYAWGKTRTDSTLAGDQVRRVNRRKPREEWLVLHRDHHEGYIQWYTHERIQAMIQKNRQVCRGAEPGAAKRGSALLAGLIRCRRCGMKLMVRYTGGGTSQVPRYVCHRGYEGSGKRRCIGFGGTSADEMVSREVMRVVEPAAMDAAWLAARQVMEHQDQATKALELEAESARYEADRAWRQYNAADPENRLVAGELERRWNIALAKVQRLEGRIARERQSRSVPLPPTIDGFQDLARDLARVWGDAGTDMRLKKRILRTLIEEVIADVDAEASEVLLVVHWKGGAHTELRVPRRRSGQTRRRVPVNIIEAVRNLARLCSDDRIAAWLTRNGLQTSGGNCWTRQHVTGLRHRHDIPVYQSHHQDAEGWMNLTDAATFLGIDRVTLRVAVERGQIKAVRPLPVGPWLLRRDDLQSSHARKIVARVHQHRRSPRRDVPGQLSLDLPSTS